MVTKVCTKCNIEKDVKDFSKDKGQKSGLRPSCKECSYAVTKLRLSKSEDARQKNREAQKRYRINHLDEVRERQKVYEQNPKRKARKNERANIYYYTNHEKEKEKKRLWSEKNYSRIKDKKNLRQKTKWQQDEEYRKEMLKQAAERYKANRELFCESCNKELPKYSIKYCDDCRAENYRKKQIDWQSKVGKDYLNELQNRRVKKRSEKLTDGYIAGQIRGGKFPGWKKEEIPNDLIELKRNVIKLKRQLKNKKQ